jgi:hypothetical protein
MATGIDKEGTTQALWLGLTLRVLIGLEITWLLYYMQGAFGLVFAAPVRGALLAKPILEVISTFTRGLRASAFADWAGEVITFETHRLRIALVGGYPWIVDRDLLAVLGEKPSDALRRRYDAALCAQIPDTKLWGFSEAGATKLLTASRHPDAHKLRLLLERQVFLPARKRRERAVG